MSQGGGGTAGTGGATACQVLKDGEVGMNGLTQIYTAKNGGSALSPLGMDDDGPVFQAEGKLFSLPAAGGPAKELGAFYGDHALVHGGKVYAESALGQGPRRLFSAPLTDLTMQTMLTDTIDDPYKLVADDAFLYYDHRTAPAIYQVPIAGGTPVKLVPDATPSAMVGRGGYLYWLDSKTRKLERVPVGGGPREPLVDMSDGSSMVATDTAIYWIGAGPDAIVKWEMGATKTQLLSKKVKVFGSDQALAVSGNTVYWVFGFGCSELYQVNTDGTGEALFARGMNASEWIGVTETAVFVMGGIGSHAYRAER
jgi:hypothetical protein